MKHKWIVTVREKEKAINTYKVETFTNEDPYKNTNFSKEDLEKIRQKECTLELQFVETIYD